MNKRTFTTLFCSSLAVLVSTQMARADVVARYECNMVDFFTQEPIGDRPDHNLSLLQYSCAGVDGLLKGALYSGSNTIEWDGPKGRIIVGGGVHRIPGGRVVTELTEGAAAIITKDGKFVGNEASGKGVVKLATGPFAALNGKTVRFNSTPISPVRWILELTTD
ncbi:hypothetical protein [Bradyrhizobium sp. CCGUVB23]|uniref:hypothetical protein n=1 Tax=Bradyrhizobium sp. CCGUVB23 TaxID=2949630 RepID=UPI0020B42D14|nr:hypothetical protein [Bradyrhizobium sp. CCGUVB23]MCP3463371.1 hypothetical protein [Bradyrhizobium sp. CCGUVB23]